MKKLTGIIDNYMESIRLAKSRVNKITSLLSKETDDAKIKSLSKRRLLLYEEIRDMTEIISKIKKYEKRGDFYGTKN